MEIGVRCDGGIVACSIVLLVNTLVIGYLLGHYSKSMTQKDISSKSWLSDIDYQNL
jgi:hypothetical protein